MQDPATRPSSAAGAQPAPADARRAPLTQGAPTRGASARDDAGAAVDRAPQNKTRILNRLRRLEGQVRGLQKMVDEDRACEDVLTLLAGVRAALDATADAILQDYLETCAAAGEQQDPSRIVRAVRLARG